MPSRTQTKRENLEMVRCLNRDGRYIAQHFGLAYKVIEAERGNVKSRYGVCFEDGTIRIRLRNSSTGEPLKYSSLINTLCHELAHLRHFNHGPGFKRFYAEILMWSKKAGIYRPRGESPRQKAARRAGALEAERPQLPLRSNAKVPVPVGRPQSPWRPPSGPQRPLQLNTRTAKRSRQPTPKRKAEQLSLF